MPETLLDPFFAKLETRDALSPAEREALLAAAGPPIDVPAGRDLAREGQRPDRSTLVLSGFSARYNLLAHGERQITALHVAGDFIDLQSFVLKEMDHSVGALSDCRVATFPHQALTRITEDFPHLTRVLWLSTLLDSAIQRQWIVAMGRRSAGGQMAHLICELYVRLRIVGLVVDDAFDFPLTQTELSDALGISAVHVNRVLQQLRAEHLFSWENRQVRILDWQRLQQRAEFDEHYLHVQSEPR